MQFNKRKRNFNHEVYSDTRTLKRTPVKMSQKWATFLLKTLNTVATSQSFWELVLEQKYLFYTIV